jgi:hypothetical protein
MRCKVKMRQQPEKTEGKRLAGRRVPVCESLAAAVEPLPPLVAGTAERIAASLRRLADELDPPASATIAQPGYALDASYTRIRWNGHDLEFVPGQQTLIVERMLQRDAEIPGAVFSRDELKIAAKSDDSNFDVKRVFRRTPGRRGTILKKLNPAFNVLIERVGRECFRLRRPRTISI